MHVIALIASADSLQRRAERVVADVCLLGPVPRNVTVRLIRLYASPSSGLPVAAAIHDSAQNAR